MFCDWGNCLALVQAASGGSVKLCPHAVLPSPAGRFPWVRLVLEVDELCVELTRTGMEQHVLKARGQRVTQHPEMLRCRSSMGVKHGAGRSGGALGGRGALVVDFPPRSHNPRLLIPS